MRRITKKRVPFLVLFVISLALLGREFSKTRDKKQLITLLMSQIGLAYIFEYFVLVLGKAYAYKPKISRKSYVDNIIGGVFSQSIFIPIASVVLVKAKSGWLGKISTAAMFMMIEFFFIKRKIYRTNWWTPLYTFLLLPLYFKWAQYWDQGLSKGNPIVRFISYFYCIWVTGLNTLFGISVTRSYKFGIGKKHTWREHFIVGPLFSVILTLLATVQVLTFPRVGPVIMYVEAVLVDLLFLKKGLIHSRYSYPPDNIFGHLAMAWITEVYRSWIYDNDPK